MVISTSKHKKRTTQQKLRQLPKLNLKRVKALATTVSAVLLALKLLVEIVKLIFSS